MTKINETVSETTRETTNAQGIVAKKKRNSQEDFIKAFQLGNSYVEVAKSLNVTVSCVYSRAKKYRTAGVNLKTMKKANQKSLDVKAANALITELAENSS